MGTNSYAHPPLDPTRFPAGVSNVNVGETLGNMGQLDPTKFLTFFEDMYVQPQGWDGTPTLIDGDGGLAQVAAGGQVTTEHACVQVSPQRRLFAKVRFRIPVLPGAIIFGFADDFTGLQEAIVLIFATNNPGSVQLRVSNASGSALSADVELPANAEFGANIFLTLGLEYIPNEKTLVYVNDQAVAAVYGAEFLPTALTKFGIFNDGASSIDLDYIFGAVERSQALGGVV